MTRGPPCRLSCRAFSSPTCYQRYPSMNTTWMPCASCQLPSLAFQVPLDFWHIHQCNCDDAFPDSNFFIDEYTIGCSVTGQLFGRPLYICLYINEYTNIYIINITAIYLMKSPVSIPVIFHNSLTFSDQYLPLLIAANISPNQIFRIWAINRGVTIVNSKNK